MQSLQSFHHIKDGSGSYDAVVWDAAPPSCQPGTIPPSDCPAMEEDGEEEDREITGMGKTEQVLHALYLGFRQFMNKCYFEIVSCNFGIPKMHSTLKIA